MGRSHSHAGTSGPEPLRLEVTGAIPAGPDTPAAGHIAGTEDVPHGTAVRRLAADNRLPAPGSGAPTAAAAWTFSGRIAVEPPMEAPVVAVDPSGASSDGVDQSGRCVNFASNKARVDRQCKTCVGW